MTDESAAMSFNTNDPTIEHAVGFLNRLLSHKTDSLFRVVLEASPFVTDGDAERHACVRRVAWDHEEQARALAGLILALDSVPNPTGHDVGTADLNYLSIAYLMRELAEYQEHVLEEAREGLALLARFPEAEMAIRDLISRDELDLRDIEALR